MLDPLYNAFGAVLAFFYAIIPNEGVAIILLTITVMLVLFPLTAKSARSMLAMQRLQPEIKKLQAKHKGDRQKLNEEMMKLYQEQGQPARRVPAAVGAAPGVLRLFPCASSARGHGAQGIEPVQGDHRGRARRSRAEVP